ncbi:uncharacterized protein LOC101849432 [Aplysia californica]|uniref:Uncharacterized protein LOC101849432 n=1 Tax=Aplysia californica TaxID=6500 RepID=A0ABM0JEH8_APLCA|nr:uncharacterized protein LOC101849432 [Aplysia californica]
MSLLMLKTKNLSWQDHTLNIEVMLAPLRSTLLLNKHKTLDTKYDKEKALFERQKDACIKDFVVEKRLIERRRQKLNKRKKDILAETRAKSALEKEDTTVTEAVNQERSYSAPGRDRTAHDQGASYNPCLPKLTLKHTPLFGGTPLRPRLFLETGLTSEGKHGKPRESIASTGSARYTQDGSRKSTLIDSDRKPPIPPPKNTTGDNQRGLPRRIPGVTFLDFLDQDDSDDENNNIIVEVKPKTVEEKVREFLRDMEKFNSRPATACSSAGGRTDDSLVSSRYTRMSERSGASVANRYNTFSMDKKSLEKAFDRYCEKKSHEDLLKAMKLAAKMKAHIRQARNASLVPTMAAFKSSRSFMRLLKRQQRKDKQAAQGMMD